MPQRSDPVWGRVAVLSISQQFRTHIALLLACIVLLVTLYVPEVFAAEKYKSYHMACWECAGTYHGTMLIGIRVNFDSSTNKINWIKVNVCPFYTIYPTADGDKTNIKVTKLQYKQANGNWFQDWTVWETSARNAEYIYYPNNEEEAKFGYPEIWVNFEVHENIPQSQHRWQWSAQYYFGGSNRIIINNNEPGYHYNTPAGCPYCKFNKTHPV